MSQARQGVFMHDDGRLVPVGDHSIGLLEGIKPGERVLVQIKRARWIEHHRLAFAVLQRLSDATGIPVEAILLWLKWETGYCDWVRLPDGRTVPSPRSISFESMDQGEFQTFWDVALEAIKDHMLAKLPARQFKEVRDLIAGERTGGIMKLIILISAAVLLVSSPAAAVPCQTVGKHWRLIDGKRCYTDRWRSKSGLYWAGRRADPEGRRLRERTARHQRSPVITDPKPSLVLDEAADPVGDALARPPDLAEALRARAEAARLALLEPKPVRTVLINPAELPAPAAEDIPMPRPRPELTPPPRPILAPWWGMLLAMLLMGSAATEGR